MKEIWVLLHTLLTDRDLSNILYSQIIETYQTYFTHR